MTTWTEVLETVTTAPSGVETDRLSEKIDILCALLVGPAWQCLNIARPRGRSPKISPPMFFDSCFSDGSCSQSTNRVLCQRPQGGAAQRPPRASLARSRPWQLLHVDRHHLGGFPVGFQYQIPPLHGP